MPSNIVTTVPVAGNPTTASVRNNFQIAHDEITALQNTPPGSGGSPAGAAGNVQYNSAGTSFGGSTGLMLNPTSVTGMTMALGTDAPGDLYFRNAAGAVARLGIGTAGQVLEVTSGLPQWGTVGTGSGTVGSGNGGQIAQYAAGTNVSVVGGVTVSGDATIAAGGALTLKNTGPGGTFAYPTSLTFDLQGRLTAATAGSAPVAPPTAANPTGTIAGPMVPGTAPTFMRSDAAPQLGTIGVANGGTGATTLTQYGALLGNGTGVIAAAVPAAAGTVLTSGGPGVNPSFQPAAGGPAADPVTRNITIPTTAISQATATSLNAGFNEITTVPPGGFAALPVGTIGGICKIRNSGANPLAVCTPSGSSAIINGLTTTASVTVPVDTTGYFESVAATQWYTVP